MKELDKRTSSTASATMSFVDRVEEMSRIRDALKVVKTGEGQLLIIRGEAGSGKTRMVQEAAAEAEKQGFSIGFSTALAESVVSYHPWKEALEGLGLDAILDEPPPPKLLGLYLLTHEGHIQVRVEREDIDSDFLSDLASTLEDSIPDSKSRSGVAEGELSFWSQDDYRLLLHQGPTFHLGAILKGQEDESFLADMMALADKEEPHQDMEAHMRKLLDSETYEGVDYAKEDPKLRQNKLFEHITLGLSRKAGYSHVCVIIDDLQWADPSSLAFLQYAARNTRKTGILILGTYRIEEAEARPQLRDALKGMEQEEILVEMDLGGLTREDLADLARSFIGSHALPETFLDLLWQETQGYPLFVREVLRGLEEDGAIEVRGGTKTLVRSPDQLSLPERVREVISSRLNKLPKTERRLLDAAATCGTRFTAAFVAKVAEEGEVKVLNGLNTIAKIHGLLRLTEDGFAFDHPAVQEVIYDDVPQEVRQTYHKEAAEWLELVGAPIEDIGEHYYRARDRRAAAKLGEAASEAVSRFANKEAIRFYDEALELEEDALKRMGILESLGDVFGLIGDYEKSIESYVNALELAGENRKRVEIKAKTGEACIRTGEYDDAIEHCTEALDLAKGEECKEGALALNNLGLAHYYRGEYDRALEYDEKSLEIREKIGDQKGIAGALNDIGTVHHSKGEFDRALKDYEKSLEIREKIGDQQGVGHSLNNIGTVHHVKGELDRALRYYEKSLGIRERIGDQFFIAILLNNIGTLHYDGGAYDEALQHFQKSLEIRERIGDQRGISGALTNIGLVRSFREEHDRALEHHEESLEIRERIGDPKGIAESLSNIGFVHFDRGEYDRALDYYEKSLEIRERIGDQRGLAWLLCEMADVHFGKGDQKKALSFCNRAFDLSREIGSRETEAYSRRILGMVLGRQKKWRESIENFERSIETFKEIRAERELGLSYYKFGLMWKAKGDYERAREALGMALEVFESLQLDGLAREVRGATQGLKC